MYDLRYSLDLQMFAEGGEGGAPADSGGMASNPTPWGIPADAYQGQAVPTNPLFADDAVPPANQDPTPQQPQPVEFDFAGRKIAVTDPAVAEALRAVHGDYTNLNKTFTQTSQRLKEMEAQIQAYQQMIQALPAAQAQSQQQPQQPQKTPEEMAQEFMDKFYDNPQEALQEMFQQFFKQTFEKELKPVIEPVQKIAEERQLIESVTQLKQKYPDFEQVSPVMQQVIQENPDILKQHGLETVYFIARGRAAQFTPPQPSPEQLLSDPNFVQQHILNNQQIVQQAVAQYMKQKQQQQSQTPTVIGGQPGGHAPSVPPERPTDIRGGTKAWLKSLGLR